MRFTKKFAAIGGIALAAGAVAVGISPVANAASGSDCGWSPGSVYEICTQYTTGTGGGVTGLATSWNSAGIDFHVQLLSPSGSTLCDSVTKVNNAGTTVACEWDHSGSIPAGDYCTVNWQYMNGEYSTYGKACEYIS
jgi:hypothetical protein